MEDQDKKVEHNIAQVAPSNGKVSDEAVKKIESIETQPAAPPAPKPITCPHCRMPLQYGQTPTETMFPNGQKAQTMVYSCVNCGSCLGVSHIGIVQPTVISEADLRRGPASIGRR